MSSPSSVPVSDFVLITVHCAESVSRQIHAALVSECRGQPIVEVEPFVDTGPFDDARIVQLAFRGVAAPDWPALRGPYRSLLDSLESSLRAGIFGVNITCVTSELLPSSDTVKHAGELGGLATVPDAILFEDHDDGVNLGYVTLPEKDGEFLQGIRLAWGAGGSEETRRALWAPVGRALGFDLLLHKVAFLLSECLSPAQRKAYRSLEERLDRYRQAVIGAAVGELESGDMLAVMRHDLTQATGIVGLLRLKAAEIMAQLRNLRWSLRSGRFPIIHGRILSTARNAYRTVKGQLDLIAVRADAIEAALHVHEAGRRDSTERRHRDLEFLVTLLALALAAGELLDREFAAWVAGVLAIGPHGGLTGFLIRALLILLLGTGALFLLRRRSKGRKGGGA